MNRFLAVLALSIAASPALAMKEALIPILCDTAVFFSTSLAEEGMKPALAGKAVSGITFEFWANPQTGEWSLIAVAPDGETCIIAGGDGAAPGKTALPPAADPV